ncbi:MAG: hypothetical protein PHC46_03090 [Clostridia bacterium]|nr:hypothetical protein [Clostridia bacterium]
MLNNLERAIMLLLYDRCANKESVLLSPSQIIISLLPKYQITIKALDKIINNLVLDGYIDVINSDSKGKPIYCVSLKMKGIAFKRELVNQKKNNRYLLIRTVILAVISVTVTLILRALFF